MKTTFTCLTIMITMVSFISAQVRHPLTTLSVPGRLQYLHTADLNGDSLQDILILHHESDDPHLAAKRYLSIFFNDRGHFSSQPCVTYEADNQEIVVDWADIDTDGLLEILFLKEDGVYSWDWNVANVTERLLPVVSLFRGPDPNRLVHWHFTPDLNGDGFPEILIPDTDRLQIFSQNLLGQYRPVTMLWTPVRHQVIPGDEAHTRTLLPRFDRQDINGDGRLDLLLISEDRLDVFLQTGLMIENGSALKPPDFRYRFTTKTVDQNLPEQFTPVKTDIRLMDLDQDGFSDLILSRVSRAGLTSALSQLQIHNNNGRFNPLPDNVLIAENFDGAYWLHDINRDGRMDAALLQFPIGIMDAAKYIFTRRIKYAIDLYIRNESGKYPDKPTKTIHCTRDSRLQNIFRPSVIAFTDWNGDGFTDLLISTGERTLVCHHGLPNGLPDNNVSERMRVEVSNHFEVTDLNQDGIGDLIFWHRGRAADQPQCILMISEPETHP